MHNIIFLHIPKAAGSTLASILRRQYRTNRYYLIKVWKVKQSVDRLSRLANQPSRKPWLLNGHHHFGLHRFLPGETRYLSIMREPVDRTVSLYYFIKRKTNHYLYKQVEEEGMSLLDFAGSDMAAELDNAQVRLFCGEEAALPYGEINSSHLETAKKNIEQHFDVVGLQERFDETLLLMYSRLGWKKLPVYLSQNVTKSRPKEIDEVVCSKILEVNRFDLELYEWVRLRFETELERINNLDELVGDFEAEKRKYTAKPHPVLELKALVKKVLNK